MMLRATMISLEVLSDKQYKTRNELTHVKNDYREKGKKWYIYLKLDVI